jgi:hypothetical protein
MNPRDEPLRLIHHHPGRLRVRARSLVDAPEHHPALVGLREAAAGLPLRHEPLTGSVVVSYPPGTLDPDELLEKLAAAGGFAGLVHDPRDHVHRRELVDMILDAGQHFNQAVRELTDDRADLRELLPAALAVTSLVSFIRGGGGTGILPRWDAALWWCQSMFMDWHREALREHGIPYGTLSGSGSGP